MSTALALSGVTSVIQNLLNTIYSGAGLGSVTVSAVAPDIVQSSLGSSSNSPLQVNLFLHQVTPNAAWRNVGLPSLAADGNSRLSNQPLALDLHYLMTAYASEDWAAEALLGYGVQMVHETPILPRSQVRAILSSLTTTNAGNPLSGLLGASGLADQLEMIKITPATLGREEMAWLWTALKADYRPTFPFQVSVVLIQAKQSILSSLPVLQQKITAQTGLLFPQPSLTAVVPPNGQPAASLGDTVTVEGTNLTGATGVTLSNATLGVQQSVTTLTNAGPGSFQFALNLPAAQLPAGTYLLSVQVPSATGPDTLQTSSLPLVVAPRITSPPTSVTIDSKGNANVSITCTPQVWPNQQVFLLIGAQAAAAAPISAPSGSLSFAFTGLQSASQPLPMRLQVDGIGSPVIDMTQTPPVFTGPSVTVTL